MEITYDSIVKWMQDYFKVYSMYGQAAETAHRLDDYFTPDLEFTPYIAALGGPQKPIASRDDFLSTAISHPSWYEVLTPVDTAVDERRLVVVVMFKLQVIDKKAQQVVVEKSAMSHYQLVREDGDALKISKIKFFWEVMPPGVPEFYDLFGRDR
jgi:hypothetical protein